MPHHGPGGHGHGVHPAQLAGGSQGLYEGSRPQYHHPQPGHQVRRRRRKQIRGRRKKEGEGNRGHGKDKGKENKTKESKTDLRIR
jgi:hypothetical protein